MNLYDIVRRSDLGLKIEGEARAFEHRLDNALLRAVEIAPGAVVTLSDAHRITALALFPRLPHWRCLAGTVFVYHSMNGDRHLIAQARAGWDVCFDWPPLFGAFDLLITAGEGEAAILSTGELYNSRRKMAAFLRGKGIEVGPGIRPIITPSETIDVEYVEERTPEEWSAVYAKTTGIPDHLTSDILARYRVGSALTLAEWADDSLDFIFSNHVFEHLMNPAQVLRNWMAKLKVGGHILGVIPDARYTFDLRQPLTQTAEFVEELGAGSYDVPAHKYDRWVRYTEPRVTPQSLVARGYSVHIHNYTPEIFRNLVQVATGVEHPPLFLDSVPNHKDFGFILQRTK